MKVERFPYFELEGTSYEIGYQHGIKAKKQVENSIKTYKEMFLDYANLSWEEAKRKSKKYIEFIKEYDEEILEEMKGIADGAGTEFADILVINARSAIILMKEFAGGCTSLALEQKVTEDKNTIIGQNWDWKETQIDSCIILKIKQINKPDILMITEGGIIGKIGFNSYGLGVCLNALCSDGIPDGIPVHVILRGILNSSTLGEAIEKVICYKNACAANYMIASKDNLAINIEMTPDNYDVLYSNNNILTHTNHYTSSKLKNSEKIIVADTFVRLARVNKLLNESKNNISIENIKKIFKDHVNYPDAICRHENQKVLYKKRLSTIFSIIMNLNKREVLISRGSPCKNEYVCYSL